MYRKEYHKIYKNVVTVTYILALLSHFNFKQGNMNFEIAKSTHFSGIFKRDMYRYQ